MIKPYSYLFRQKPVRTCIYARVSTRKSPQLRSLSHQQEAYAKLSDEEPNCILTEIYVDSGSSGHSSRRKGFQRMKADAAAGKFQLILTKSISRFARNTVILLETVRQFKHLGIGVYFESEQIYTLSGEGEFMLSVLASLAEEESQSISKNVRWAIQKQFQRGIPTALTRNFNGYLDTPERILQIDPGRAAIVQSIYQLYYDGCGVRKIARYLQEKKVPTISGGNWDAATIRYILSNEKYKGDRLLQKYYTPEHLRQKGLRNTGQVQSYYLENHHEAIIDRQLWEEIQLLRAKRSRQFHIDLEHTAKYGNRYEWSGRLLCPYCGKHLTRQTLPSGRIQWNCATHRQKASLCPGMIVRDVELLAWAKVQEKMCRQILHDEIVVEEVKIDGNHYHCYTSRSEFECGKRQDPFLWQEPGSRLLPCVHRSRRTAIQL